MNRPFVDSAYKSEISLMVNSKSRTRNHVRLLVFDETDGLCLVSFPSGP